ncbi:alpha/beta hydrolase [Streptomyces sp. NPDC094034]|uniref:alpha/beta hydrolase n=1 Tax=Streptomyces sp. NPDC094034 TaxID=3155309 RepID=UPI0033246CD2
MARIDVTIDSAGIPLAGHLYLPDTTVEGPRPAIVVGHPGSGVKEQVAGVYAERLAKKGFITVAFDAAFQGESGGLPHGLEDPAHRVEDLKAVVSYFTTREDVDPERIGALGICASGGYALNATAGDHRIKALGTVCAVDLSRHFRFGGNGTQDPAVIRGMLDAAAGARTGEAQGGEAATMKVLPNSLEEARAVGGDYGAEGFAYHNTIAFHPRSDSIFTLNSVDRIVSYDTFAAIPLIGERPVLMIAGTRAATSWMSIDAFQRLTGPKEFFWAEGASHQDLYYKDEYVDPAVDKLADFFTEKLDRTA